MVFVLPINRSDPLRIFSRLLQISNSLKKKRRSMEESEYTYQKNLNDNLLKKNYFQIILQYGMEKHYYSYLVVIYLEGLQWYGNQFGERT